MILNELWATAGAKYRATTVKKNNELPVSANIAGTFRPLVREFKTVLDSGFHDVDSSLCKWKLDPGFQSFVGFRISWAVFWIPKPKIADSTSKNFPDTGILILLLWLTHAFCCKVTKVSEIKILIQDSFSNDCTTARILQYILFLNLHTVWIGLLWGSSPNPRP